MIITVYTPDGRKTRRPIGYGGELCHKATQPYEARELNTKKVATDEALNAPAATVQADEHIKLGS